MKLHLTPVGNAAPPRPRRFEFLTSLIMSSVDMSNALRSALYPPLARYTSSFLRSGMSSQRVSIRSTCIPVFRCWLRSSGWMLFAERHQFLLLPLDFALQRHQRVEHAFGPRRTSGNIHIDRHDPVYAGQRRVVVVETAGRRACAKRHHPFRLGHLIVHAAQNRSLADGNGADDHQQVGLAWREARQQRTEAA